MVKRKETSLPAKMKDTQATQEISVVLQSEVHEQEDKMENQAQTEDTRDDLSKTERSLVHFFPTSMDSDTTTLPRSWSLSDEIPLSYYLSSPQVSGVTLSTIGPKLLKPALVRHSQSEDSLGLNNFKIPKKHTMAVLASQPAVIGEGEDYFLSLFGDSKKLVVRSFHTKKTWKRFSMILEEVGQSRSRSGQQHLKQSTSHHQIFFGRNKTDLGQAQIVQQSCASLMAVAWYTPIYWKQAREKLETDTECDTCSVVSPTSHWPAATNTTKEKQDQSKQDISKYQVEHVRASLTREKEIPPTLFPNRSPWCHSPNVSAHPYCSLIDPHNTYMTERSLDRQPRSQSARPDPARDQGKTGHLSYKSNRQSIQLLKDNNIQV
ncbi:lamin tail domain-containing protein 1 isoform X8 [Kogia breviceps]|uniref:lamin tail domain-containing protein 1 isoform X8 n=1 Tax=Kogia breviceps TaxID=27615 RepID=UPI0034D24BF5